MSAVQAFLKTSFLCCLISMWFICVVSEVPSISHIEAMRKQSQKPLLMNLRRVTDFVSAFFAFSTSCSMLGRAYKEQIRKEVQQSWDASTKEKKLLVYPDNTKPFCGPVVRHRLCMQNIQFRIPFWSLAGFAIVYRSPHFNSTTLYKWPTARLPLASSVFYPHFVSFEFNRPFSLVDFVLPTQIMWRYPGEYFLWKLHIFTLDRRSFYWTRQMFKPPRYLHMICVENTKSTLKRQRSLSCLNWTLKKYQKSDDVSTLHNVITKSKSQIKKAV